MHEQSQPFQSGIEVLLRNQKSYYDKGRVGVLCHSASINHAYKEIVPILLQNTFEVTCIFAPEHGYNGAQQDQKHSEDMHDPVTGLPVYSLYGSILKPTDNMLQAIDIVLIDLQDIGTRVYTYIYTMALTMQACASHGKKVLVLDRPNPIRADLLEGTCLDLSVQSFVGMYPIPMRHGLTIGELAVLFNQEYGIHCDLKVVPMANYCRHSFYDEIGTPWVMPSPNMPTLDTAIVYPGSVLFEGTMLSEGRGTTRPFELIGAPYIDAFDLAAALNELGIAGVHFRPVYFEPTFNKYKGELCGGIQIHVIDRNTFQAYTSGLAILKTVIDMYPDSFEWQTPPYEYEYKKPPIDLLVGNSTLRQEIHEVSFEVLRERYTRVPEAFLKTRAKYLIYS